VVISLGGSTIVPEEIDIDFLKEFRKLILKYVKKGMTFVLISGGGRSARHYQHAASKIARLNAEDLDWIGVHSTRLNAQLLRTIFRDIAYQRVIKDPTKPIETKKKIIIAAGWKPGFSTDYDAVLLAKNLGVDTVVNMSNVPYVYDKNPKKFKNAKPLKELSWVDYIKMVGMEWRPGRNVPFDPIASTEAHKSEIKVIVMGNDLKNFENFLLGRKFEGTVIS
jgi:uridylate kinase